MKTVKLNDHFLWKGELTQCMGIADGKSIVFNIKTKCPHCGEEINDWHNILENSPLFQENAEAINTIEN